MANAGDVNGDGYSDVIVGANQYMNKAGRASVVLAAPDDSTTFFGRTVAK